MVKSTNWQGLYQTERFWWWFFFKTNKKINFLTKKINSKLFTQVSIVSLPCTKSNSEKRNKITLSLRQIFERQLLVILTFSFWCMAREVQFKTNLCSRQFVHSSKNIIYYCGLHNVEICGACTMVTFIGNTSCF